MIFRLINGVMVLLFAFSVAVQYNDPDPVRWMAIYGFAALACLLQVIGKLRWQLPAATGAAALIWAVIWLPQTFGTHAYGRLFDSFEMHDEAVEEAREALGLLIVATWMAVLVVFRRKPAAAAPAAGADTPDATDRLDREQVRKDIAT